MAGNKIIKHSAITRAGYEYQDLVGIEILIRHYRDQNLFEWVQLESDDSSIKALDDVVARRKDGSVEYVQVKFTVDPAKYELNWDYLLSKTEKGSSMLAKWAGSLRRAKASGPIHSAQLKTNRVPSADFEACLDGKLVDLAKVDPATLALIEAECGGQAAAREFFQTFEFTARLPDLDRFEVSLKDQLVPTDTTTAGWHLLRNEVTRWAMLQREPPPDGRILREHVVRLISEKRPRPLLQDFLVPPGYAPPSESFHAALRERIVDPATPLTVVWATPGRGKSTYLSFLASQLQTEDQVVIRHHYFLSTEDTSSNRASYVDIATSLYDQLRGNYPEYTAGMTDDPDHLHLALKIVAENLAKEGKRLYLIVDGLDHVYRDTARTDQLDHLFNSLFPLPDNLSLVVGTQRVADAQLPAKLVTGAEEQDWVEIPRMDEAAVRRWVANQDAARPLRLQWEGRREEEIEKVGAAFFRISQGHPLHLIFAFEGLVLSGVLIDEDAVLALPGCPDGDIRSYYRGLWQRISAPSRSILHMLAGSEFFWPSGGIRKCMGDFGEVAFLLEPHRSGMMPFHGSIFAWLRERDDHEESYNALLPTIVKWLGEDAPEYWRWGWLWLTKAKVGETAHLLTGTTREWAVASLANGWPETQITNILSAAENLTFAAADLPTTVRLRALKTRVSNVREYQAWDFGSFRSAALSVFDNLQQARNLLDDLQNFTVDEISSLARYGPAVLRAELVDACLGELRRRINTWVVLRHRSFDDFGKLSTAALEVAALAGTQHVERTVRFLKGFKDPSVHMSNYIKCLARSKDIDSLDTLSKHLSAAKWSSYRRAIQVHILRCCLLIGADPAERLKKGTFKHDPVAAAWICRSDPVQYCPTEVTAIPDDLLSERNSPGESVDLERFFHDAFWIALRANLIAVGEFSPIYPGLDREKSDFVDRALECLETCAEELAGGTAAWTFSTPFLAAADIAPIPFSGRNETEQARYAGFRKSLNKIALDVHLFGLPNKYETGVPEDEFEIARGSAHWVDELWVDFNAEDRTRYLSKEAASTLLKELVEALSAEVTEFNERADKWTKYAALAHLYDVDNPQALLRRAASCLLGYGYRKDPFVFEVLDSIKDVHKIDPKRTLERIQRIAPIVDRITDFTDSDGTRHSRSQLISLSAKTAPNLLPKLYEHHIEADEWYYADKCIEAFIEFGDLSTPEAAALVGTLLDAGTLGKLEERAKTDPAARELLEVQTEFLGGTPPPTERDYSTPDRDLTDAEKAAVEADPTVFASDDFAGIAAAVGARDFHYSKRPDFLRRWLEHWHAKGKARKAIASTKAYFDSDTSTYNTEDILDHVFDVSLAVEGKDAAYPWLVMAQIRRHGWDSHFTSQAEVERRIGKLAAVYPERWLDFVRDTSAPLEFFARRGYSFSIGFHHLVIFLLAVGQAEIAKSVTDEFIATLIAETDDVPLGEATWLQ